ncbi:uncharacterized protein LOC129583684 [Paramacrobiotus metropolitanus]|uniref:uncharacterized protein LOC129583684 n=1 Tax=Paramacrobiotus metropolitanus TaxID=2943436 RepID=UPI0024459EF0|nr:uncharacterized protein LOC129583684 [Paramacrobiotus metropolitanus]XP_055331576.1 uncharacterized protein LOC129583684 [Paramacrobiotus metropolitanus]XP_055331578.1 uncharacterized protein LOC129583684 [Paramacrobiotus metropolitanus]
MDSLACPKCQHRFTYLEREEHSGHFPLVLNCGHGLCYSCVWETLSHEISSGKSQHSAHLSCALCGQNQPPVESLERQDVVRRFPVDFVTVGVLVALDSFGPNIFQFNSKILPLPSALRSSLEEKLKSADREREEIFLERPDSCCLCASIHCGWKCLTCKLAFCMDCWPQHQQSCPDVVLSTAVPFDCHGNPMEPFRSCAEHNRLQQWHCNVHDEHKNSFLCVLDADGRQKKRLFDCSFTTKAEKNEDAVPSFLDLHPRIIALAKRSGESLKAIRRAKRQLEELNINDQLKIRRLFHRLTASAVFSCNNLILLQENFSGIALAFLEDVGCLMNKQSKWTTFLLERWNFIVTNVATLPIKLYMENTALEENLLRCQLWCPDRMREICLHDAPYISESVWNDGLPKGLRMIFMKTIGQLKSAEDLLPTVFGLSSVRDLVKVVHKHGHSPKYDLQYDLGILTERSVVLPVTSLATEFQKLKNTVFNVQGMIPRQWNADHLEIIDANPAVCRVTHVENDQLEFWIRNSSYDGKHKELHKALNIFCCKAVNLESIAVDGIYGVQVEESFGRLSGFKKGYPQHYGWMRVRITKVDANGDQCQGHLLDHGATGAWKLTDLREIPQSLQREDPFAIRAQLSSFVPSYKVNKCWPNIGKFVLQWLSFCGSPFVLLDDYVTETGLLLVDVWSDSRTPSLREYLVWCGAGELKVMSDARKLYQDQEKR